MTTIEKMLTGEIPMKEFVRLLISEQQVQSELNNLIPEEAKWDEDHPLWKHVAFSFLLEYDFDLHRGIMARRLLDDSMGDNLNIWGTIHRIYEYINPDLPFTTKYEDDFQLYLDVVKEIYDGPEVRGVLYTIFNDAFKIKGKAARKKTAKEAILKAFHIEDKKHPRWIQGGEWPMGEKSPMKFISQKSKGEEIDYIFQDVDTEEIRIIKQYY
jgi:hypothetical protein